MIKTELCELLGIKHPILQGGMAWISNATLASAVSNAGGLGIITSINSSLEAVRQDIRQCKSMTDKPFGVNIMLLSSGADQIAQIVIEEEVQIVTTGAGIPTKHIDKWLKSGIKVIPVVGSATIAQRVASLGASAVIAEGGESGGHVGEMNTMPLIPQVCDVVSIPVIAAGGISDYRGLAAALMLGASGIQCGTAFLTSTECPIHTHYKNKIIASKDSDTMVTGKTIGHPIRALKNQFIRKFYELEHKINMSPEEIEKFGVGALKKAVIDGNELEGCFMAGEGAGMIKEIKSIQEIVDDMILKATLLLQSSHKLLITKP